MPKSKYPSQIDTSVEIPAVRDNVTEIGSDVINSLRSAIFQIERTLGVNPQGSSGNTLSSRVSRSLDENGNLLEDALDRANVLSGPILDEDVSNVAAIKEAKLRLDYPTNVLQTQVTVINNALDTIRDQITELSALLSAHVNPDARNRHKAIAISVAEATVLASDTATNSLEAGTSQETFEKLYNAHINYSGNSISSLNNSHAANQVYFDNDEISSLVPSNNVQGAIEDIAGIQSVGFKDALLNLHSNGRIRTGSVIDGYEGNSTGSVLLSSSVVTFVKVSGATKTTFTFSSPTTPIKAIEQFDILTLSGSDFENDNKSYQISEVSLDGSGNVTSIEVFGGPNNETTEELTAVITKNIYVVYNQNGLNCIPRPRKDKTNTPDVIVANPDAATIITTGIQPSSITSDENSFDIEIDSGSAITIETYDSSVSNQTLDSIVNRINEQSVDLHLNFSAYKVRVNNCFELALSHSLPNSADDIKNRTLKVSAGSSDDGTALLGLSDFVDITVEGTSTNSFHINGSIISEFGAIQQYTGDEIEIIGGSLNLSLFSGTFDALGTRVGDTVVITGSSDATDDGTYRIGSVAGNTITLDLSGDTLEGTLNENSLVHILRNSARVEELNFTEAVSANGSILFDVLFAEDKDIHYSKRMEIEGALSDSQFTAGIVDVSRNFIIKDDTATLTVDTDGNAVLTGPDLTDGESVFVASPGIYKIFASDRLSFVVLSVNAVGPPLSQQQVTLYGFNEISSNNLRLCRGLFATSLGIILGESNDVGVPSVIDKRRSGSVDDTIIGEAVLERYIEGPRNELRGSGIIRGMEVTNLQFVSSGSLEYYSVDVSAGIAVVNGIRYEFSGVSGFRFNSDEDFYLALDSRGCVVASAPVSNPDGYTDGYVSEISPFADQVIAHLAFIDSVNDEITDLRLFIDHIDYKLIGDIIVANSQEFGHFTNIKTAVDYARKFNSLFPEQANPTIFISEGTYDVSETIVLDFDILVRGAGPNTVITKTGTLATGVIPNSGRVDSRTSLFRVGSARDANSTRIFNGISLRDFTYVTSDDLTNVGCVIALSQERTSSVSSDATYRFENINFIGPTDINDGDAVDADAVGEFALLIGQETGAAFVPVGNLAMGNVIFTGCKLKRMGLEEGGIRFAESTGGVYSNIIVTGNIAEEMSPDAGITSFDIIEYPSTPTLTNVIENSNAVTYS